MIKIICSMFLLFVIQQSAWAADKNNGCTLKFKDNTELTGISRITWFLRDGSTFILDTYGEYVLDDVVEAKAKDVRDLVFVNNKNVSVVPNEETMYKIEFKCGKWDNDNYFAYHCKYEYGGGEQVGREDEDGFTMVYHDKCIKNNPPAETENENGTAATENDDSDDGDDDASPESADDESNKNEQFSFAKLDKILDEYFSDSSNWKNEDGNFNTARLVSDSVAGVVLGTAGGIITSKIIKKNQIKKGFEDLKCTVGAQEVATYGDEFTVGAKQ